jgi:hypothetical protein
MRKGIISPMIAIVTIILALPIKNEAIQMLTPLLACSKTALEARIMKIDTINIVFLENNFNNLNTSGMAHTIPA